ncbi:MAG: Ig-like domain repeat protein [Terracidiphilus sp.]
MAKRTPRTFVCAAVFAALALALAPSGARAQTAGPTSAQRTALAQLGRAHPQQAPVSGVEATTTALDQPYGLAFDSTGNLYIADADDNVIREVSVTGVISTVAGNGTQGYGGDGGGPTSAELDSPTGVAVDAQGDIYIADTLNNRIREVLGGTASGAVITTIAGTGVAGYLGDGGPATAAELDQPTAVALDPNGHLYIADTNNNRIREIVGGNINTVAGDGVQSYFGDGGLATAAALNSPTGVAVDQSFNIYIGDTGNQVVREVTSSTGDIATIAGTGVAGFNGDGPATSAELSGPSGVFVNSSGVVYVADSDNQRIRTISGGNVTTIAGSGVEGFLGDTQASTSAWLDTPRAVTAAGTTVLFSDTLNNRVREVAGGSINTIAGTPGSSSEFLLIGSAFSAVYGTGSLTATFSNAGQTATGLVTFNDLGNGTTIGQAQLVSNAATVSTSALAAGTHYIVASYAGNATNAPITSGVYVFVVTPAPLTAVANAVAMEYGQAVPALSGTLTGVLAQDAGNVTAVYATTATSTSAPGTYPITVTLTGSAAVNYTVTLGAGSGSVTISQAPTTTKLTASSASITQGQTLTLTAKVASKTTGTPTGTVSFYNGSTLLGTAPLSGGTASYLNTTLAASGVVYSLTATYGGDTNFSSSTSSGASVTISPDFTLSFSEANSLVLSPYTPGGVKTLVVDYLKLNLTLEELQAFSKYLTITISGLPPNVQASFTKFVDADENTVELFLTFVDTALQDLHVRNQKPQRPGEKIFPFALAALLLPLFGLRRMRRGGRRLRRWLCLLLALGCMGAITGMSGCGSANGYFNQAPHTYPITITVSNGSISHSVVVNLTIE